MTKSIYDHNNHGIDRRGFWKADSTGLMKMPAEQLRQCAWNHDGFVAVLNKCWPAVEAESDAGKGSLVSVDGRSQVSIARQGSKSYPFQYPHERRL